MDDQKQEPSPGRERTAGLRRASERSARGAAVERLASTIGSEVVPRLMFLQQSGPRSRRDQVDNPRSPSEQDVLDFAVLLIGPFGDAAVNYVERLLDSGMTPDGIALDLLAPAARRLGALWECDDCDFTSVTIGAWRLQRALERLRVPGHLNWPSADRSRSVLMTAVPGEQHTFGLMMVADLFRRDGWDVYDAPMRDAASICDQAAGDWFAFVGLSIAGDRMVEALVALIAGIRRASLNPAIGIMVGGPLIALRPGLARSLPADLVVDDARAALAGARMRWGHVQRVA